MITTPRPATPWWMIAVIIAVVLPVFQLPLLLSMAPAEPQSIKTMLYIYPFYTLLAGYLAYQVYPSRPVVAWILVALMVLTHISAYILVSSPLY